MNVKQYFRAVQSKDGNGLIKDAKEVIRKLTFKPNEIVIAERLIDEFDRFDEALTWIQQTHPDTIYQWDFDGLDWFFEDPLVAFEFKLRWC